MLSPHISAQQDTTTYFFHTIEKGQSLYSISGMYGVPETDIVRLNPGSEKTIYAGAKLRIPRQKQTTDLENERFHTIKAGETLYGLTVQYGVTAKQIMEENPGLSAQNFRIGEVIRIPAAEPIIVPEAAPIVEKPTVLTACREMHKVKRRETVKSISRAYGITEQELVEANPELKDRKPKRNEFLCIPHPKPKEPLRQPARPIADEILFRDNEPPSRLIPTIKAAVILPFLSDNRNESAKMIEYYEGFLIAVDSLKKQGISMDIYAYDSGKDAATLSKVLAKPELQQMNILFGPAYDNQVPILSDFVEQHRSRLVIPFVRGQEVYQNPYIYQVNTPHSYLYSEVYDHFVRLFPQANVILLDAEVAGNEEKAAFVTGLISELQKYNIPVHTLKGAITPELIQPYLRTDRENFFIPTSGSDAALMKIIPQLQLLVRTVTDVRVHLFGYPEWQSYTNDFLESFFELNTYFYSSFYTNNLLPSAVNFIADYHRWYSKEMTNVFPKYGMMGFDMGYFFLNGLARYGTGLEDNLSHLIMTPIQTGFKFERANNWGGFINRKVFFVHFTPEYQVMKMEFE
ncbi:MAG: LysM peptidoglycan-binding domain-containing protein [Prevotellaceae bacterium]|jgi:LysM repeat protein|nr:LysM peptidoglycan-binding domain-containing protein [Prevotellaceae bacterium]